MTATPAIAVSAETMNARPVREAGNVHGLPRRQAAVALLDEAQQDQRRELGARRDDEWTADRGHRAQLEVKRVGEQRRRADRDQHRDERQQRADDAAQPDGEEQEHEEDREVREQDAVRFEVVEQADADDREARRRGPHVAPADAPSRGSPHDRGPRVETARAGAEDDVHRVGVRPRRSRA